MIFDNLLVEIHFYVISIFIQFKIIIFQNKFWEWLQVVKLIMIQIDIKRACVYMNDQSTH